MALEKRKNVQHGDRIRVVCNCVDARIRAASSLKIVSERTKIFLPRFIDNIRVMKSTQFRAIIGDKRKKKRRRKPRGPGSSRSALAAERESLLDRVRDGDL